MVNLEKIIERIENCGNEIQEFVKSDGSIKEFPVFCDNRSCENPKCQKHRLYKYRKKHDDQIRNLNKSMKKPKAWVFTVGHLRFPIDRQYLKDKLKKLRKLLSNKKYGSVSEFSIHMELKLSKDYPDSVYLHFHVVMGGVRDLRFIRKIWGKQILYEQAIKPKELGYYVSKYASKTPVFISEYHRMVYTVAVYKLQMHRFSSGHAKYVPSGWYRMEDLYREVRNAYKNDIDDYHPFLYDRPPPDNFIEDFIEDSDLVVSDNHNCRLNSFHKKTVSKNMSYRDIKMNDKTRECKITEFYKDNGCIS